jgi:hemerythrin-like domain-containing protein
MPDYGHNLLFGSFLPPAADSADDTVRLAVLTDDLGLDLVSVQDHPYQAASLDAWTLLSVIAARTTRVRVLPNVANLPLRPPAVLARAAASLDVLTGGRVELGLGAGAFWDAVAGMGGPRRTPGESVDALTEAIGVIRALWTPGPGVRLDGRHYRLAGAHPGPVPAHDIGIWLGGYKPRMLRLTGTLADGWLPSAPYLAPDRLADANAIIDDAAREAGRDPATIRRLYNITGTFTGAGGDFLIGPPPVWVEQLAELALTEGISGFVLMVETGMSAHLRRFAEEVAPGVRELVAAERGESGHRPVVETAAANGARALGVTPTPDDGRRLSATRLWDESARPRAPGADPAARYSDAGRAGGQHLVDVHDHLRGELAELRDVVEQVAAGELSAARARSLINTMAMRQNAWTLGAFCESYCRVVTAHHTLEDRGMFPRLRQADPGLAPVLDRLEQEHHVIAEVLERVDAALVAMVTAPGGLDRVRDAVDLLTDTLLSHLSYEERELVEPLSRFETLFR